MTGCAAVGAFGKLLVMPKATPASSDPVFGLASERFSFLYETMSTDRVLIGNNLITGDLSYYGSNLVKKAYTPLGAIGLQPGPNDFDLWLPRILGNVFSGDEITVGNSLPVFNMLIHRDNGVWLYRNCRVARAMIRGKTGPTEDEGEIVSMQLTIIGEDEIDSQSWPGSEPPVPTGINNVPYTANEATLQCAGTDYMFEEFVLSIDNMLVAKHRNSLTPTCIYSQGRQVKLQLPMAFTTANLNLAKNLYTAGAEGYLRFQTGPNNTDAMLKFDFPYLRSSYKPPSTRGKGEIQLEVQVQALRTQDDEEVTVTNRLATE